MHSSLLRQLQSTPVNSTLTRISVVCSSVILLHATHRTDANGEAKEAEEQEEYNREDCNGCKDGGDDNGVLNSLDTLKAACVYEN